MTEKEIIEHELIKNALKIYISNNQSYDEHQKQQICKNIDAAAQRADWLVELLRAGGFII